ncbi:unnamed protein product [Tilletia controversa]|nr:unnamed protein product [Tilletia controversa]CAD6927772.1 unnamed protein product [Tilletia controversa]
MSASSVSAEAWQITKPGSIPDTLELRSITLPNLKPNQVLIKVSHAALNPADYKLAAILPTFIQKLLVEGTIHPVVDKVFEWKDGVEAYKYLIEGRAVGKVVVAVP